MSPDKSEHEWPMVIFDSSMLIGLLECRLDLNAEIERVLSTTFRPVILSGTLSEIKELIRQSKGGKRKKQLGLALKTAEKFNKLDYFPVDDEEMDDVIVRAARDLRTVVATNDYELRKRLVKVGIPVLFVRERSHIGVDGYLNDSGIHP